MCVVCHEALVLISLLVAQYIDSPEPNCPESYFDVFGSLVLDVGYIQECVINGAFDEIQKYDVYR